MLCHLEVRVFNRRRHAIRLCLLTVHELPHILDESADDPEGLSCGSPNLVLREAIKPLQDCLDVLVPDKVLYKIDCDVLSKVTRRRERTHLVDAA